ncbi:Serine/threonine-protein kinase HT1 [Hordeum vulgare]|nr:Serine/threonine-protein kinase HT1 [Hordeum vulgare]
MLLQQGHGRATGRSCKGRLEDEQDSPTAGGAGSTGRSHEAVGASATGGVGSRCRGVDDWSAGRLRQEVERLRLARNFGGAVKSCLADRCYAESCLVGRCYARQISRSLRIWTDMRRAVAPLGAVVALMDVWTDMDDADLFPEDGSVVP